VLPLRVQELSIVVGVGDSLTPNERGNPLLMFVFDRFLHRPAVEPVDNFYSNYQALERDAVLTDRDFEVLRRVRYLTGPLASGESRAVPESSATR
jgi:hypothetical protein